MTTDIELRKVGDKEYVWVEMDDETAPRYFRLIYNRPGAIEIYPIVRVYRDTKLKATERCSLSEIYKVCKDLHDTSVVKAFVTL